VSVPEPASETDSWQKGVRESSSLLGLGIQLAGSMLIYVLAGYFLDRWLDTDPWLLLTGSVVGMIAFLFQIVRVTRRLSTPPTEETVPSDEGTDDLKNQS